MKSTKLTKLFLVIALAVCLMLPTATTVFAENAAPEAQALAAIPKGTVVRTAKLDLSKNNGVTPVDDQASVAEGWSWVKDTKTLTLNGLTIKPSRDCVDATASLLCLPYGSTIVLTEGSENIFTLEEDITNPLIKNKSDCTLVRAYGNTTITGNGKFIVAPGDGNAIHSSSDKGQTSYGMFVGGDLEITENADVSVKSMYAITENSGTTLSYSVGLNLNYDRSKNNTASSLNVNKGGKLKAETGKLQRDNDQGKASFATYGIFASVIYLGKGRVEAHAVQSPSGQLIAEATSAFSLPTPAVRSFHGTTELNPTSGGPKMYDVLYEVGTNTVKYNSGGGSGGTLPTEVRGIADGGTVTVSPIDPVMSKDGCTFNGWNTASDGSGTRYVAGDTLTLYTDVVLYAQWKGREVDIDFNLGENETIDGEIKHEIGKDTVLPTPNKPGYEFEGWYDNPEFTGEPVTIIPADVEDVTKVYPKYTVKTITITFDAQGGTSAEAISVVYDTAIATLPTVTKEGYIFQGWFTAENGGTKVTEGQINKFPDNVTLYAQWKAPGADGSVIGAVIGGIFGVIFGILLILIVLYILWKNSVIKGEVADKIIGWMDPAAVKVCKAFCKEDKLFTTLGTKDQQKKLQGTTEKPAEDVVNTEESNGNDK